MGRFSPSGRGFRWFRASAVAPEPPISLEPIDCSMCAAVGLQFLMFGTARKSARDPVSYERLNCRVLGAYRLQRSCRCTRQRSDDDPAGAPPFQFRAARGCVIVLNI
jgi:hypothetical protein